MSRAIAVRKSLLYFNNRVKFLKEMYFLARGGHGLTPGGGFSTKIFRPGGDIPHPPAAEGSGGMPLPAV